MSIRCLLLACGNPLRGDDGIAPWLAHWAAGHLAAPHGLRILITQEWHPELAFELSQARSALLVDASMRLPAGRIETHTLCPAPCGSSFSHHCDAAALLALAQALYGHTPAHALLMSIGIEAMEAGEGFSDLLAKSLPAACSRLEASVDRLLGYPSQRPAASEELDHALRMMRS